MSDSERKHYEQLQECVDGFRSHTVTLSDLIERIPELLKDLDDIDPSWKAECVSYWWTLEQVHGAAIDLGESGRLPKNTRQTVDDAVDGIDRLVQGALATTH